MANDSNVMVLQLSADIRKLEKAFQKASGVVDSQSSAMEKRAAKMAKKISDAGSTSGAGGGAGGGIQSLIDLLTQKLGGAMDDTASQAGGLTDGLKDLGPAGLAAAVAIGAVAAALAGAREAAKFADDIADTANRLHVTTDALQEYRYAIRAAGGDEEGADAALEAFSVTLGKAQQGLAKSQKAFLALGFTKAQIQGFTDAGTALDEVVKRISGLSSIQQDAIIQQLGLEGIKPLIAEGADEMRRLRDEAHKMGVVMDAELIKRGADLNDQFENVQNVIDVQLKSALIDLGPILVGLLNLVAQMARFANDFADSMRSIPDKTDRGLDRQRAKAQAGIDALNAREKAGGLDENAKKVREKFKGIVAQIDITKNARSVSTESIASLLGIDLSKNKPRLKETPDKTGSTPKDQTGRFDFSTERAQLAAEANLYQSLLGLTDDIDSRAELQKKILAVEQKQADAQFAEQARQVNESNSTNKAEQLAQLKNAKALDDQARANDLRGVDLDRQIALSAQTLRRHQELASAQINELNAQRDLTNSRKERTKIDLEILAIQKRLEDEARKNETDAKMARFAAGSPDASSALAIGNGVQRAADAAAEADRARIIREGEGPLARYFHGIEDLNDTMENAAVNGIQDLNASIIQLAQSGGSAAEILQRILNKLLADFANAQLVKAEAGLFDMFFGGGSARSAESSSQSSRRNTGSFPSFAGGGFTGYGARTGGMDGKGGFPAMLHPWETVTDHTKPLRNVPAMSSNRGGSASISFHSTYEIAGAVGKEELRGAIERSHDKAVARATDTMRRQLPGHLDKLQKLGTT